MSALAQATLFGRSEVRVDAAFSHLRRLELPHGAYLEYQPGWLSGHEVLFEHLVRTTRWRARRRPMYDRIVDVPRLLAAIPDHGPGHPILWDCVRLFTGRYGFDLSAVSLAYYRDGRDSVAPHGDRLGRYRDDSVVAIVSVGAPRTLRIAPVYDGPRLSFRLGWGDLFVMGGSFQRTYRHGVPKVASAGGRISIQFRPAGYRDAAREPSLLDSRSSWQSGSSRHGSRWGHSPSVVDPHRSRAPTAPRSAAPTD